MKRISKLKLNAIAESRLAEREMNALRGGGEPGDCSCSCYYANNGGASVADNGRANMQLGLDSPIGYPYFVSNDWEEEYFSPIEPGVTVRP